MTEAVEAPAQTTLKELDKVLTLSTGPVGTVSGGKQVALTRKIAVIQALENHSKAEKGDKFKVVDLGIMFEKANGQISVNEKQLELIRAAVTESWEQPGICVPLRRWLKDEE